MDRFNELKAKGWLNLNKDERAEYSALKAEVDKSTESLPRSGMAQTETITVKKDDLEKMIDEIAEAKVQKLRQENRSLEKQTGLGTWSDVGERKDRQHTATFKLWRANTDQPWKIIIDWRHLRFDYDEQTRGYDKDVYKVTLMDDGGATEDVELELRDFAKISDIETVDILKMDKREQVMVVGQVKRAQRTKDGYILSSGVGLDGLTLPEGGAMVDQTVTRDHTVCTVRRKNGQQFEINADRMNT